MIKLIKTRSIQIPFLGNRILLNYPFKLFINIDFIVLQAINCLQMKLNILYLHGLNGSLSDEKRSVLENYFSVHAPQIDYQVDNITELASELTSIPKFDAIIGNSMGGFVGYHLARRMALPSLLFNPAIAERSVELNFIPEEVYGNHPNPMHIVIGKNDEVISPYSSLEAIMNDDQNDLVMITLHRNLEHRIDIETFEAEVDRFAKSL